MSGTIWHNQDIIQGNRVGKKADIISLDTNREAERCRRHGKKQLNLINGDPFTHIDGYEYFKELKLSL